jgi:hypothetical protein
MRYAQDHGDVPASLDDLVPSYVAKIEVPTVRNGQWEYYKKPYTGGFQISFSNGSWVCYKSDKRKEWVVDDG